MLQRNHLNFSKVYDSNKELIRLEVSFPIIDLFNVTSYKLISIKPEEHRHFSLYYRGIRLNKDPIEDYEIFRFIDAIKITDYGDKYNYKSKEHIKQVDIRPKNALNSGEYSFVIDDSII